MNTADGQFHLYILRCANGTYYVGSTTDVPARIAAHNAGRGPRFTASRRPVTLAYAESFDTMAEARKREIQIKKWSRSKKEGLIAGNIKSLRHLSRQRRH